MNTIIIKNLDLIINIKYNLILLFIQSIEDIINIEMIKNKISSEVIISLLKKKDFLCQNSSFQIISFFINDDLFEVAIIGISKNASHEKIKNNFGKVLHHVQAKKITDIIIEISSSIFYYILPENFAKLLQITLLLKTYQFKDFITDSKKINFIDFNCFLLNNLSNNQINFELGIKNGNIIGDSINFSRYLSDLPAKDLYPESFINIVKNKISQGNIKCDIEIFNIDKLKELGMGGILGVGQGSEHSPYLLLLKYNPEELTIKTIALVGKGVTFDTGGVSIKPSDGMEDMKADMSGAAVVVSSFIGLAKLEAPYIIYAIAPLAENMVDGNSIRPGDILKFYNGKTAEIKNTDAEGRLILADALSYVSDKIKPNYIIDLATLTGACRIALGPVYAGLMTEDSNLEKQIKEAGEKTGDRCWSLPLEDAYLPNMESNVADMCNIGTKGYKAGATMGGMFLREFVDKDVSWAHIDIAPVATDCPFKNYIPSFGATGFGVNLLIELLNTKNYLK